MSADQPTPVNVINAVAPIRICDIGGWTDTWFAGTGAVCNIAVYPYAEVQVFVFPRKERAARVTIFAENYGLRYEVPEEDDQYHNLPLVEAAVRRMPIPEDLAIEVSIHSEVPPGASTGTSAAVAVASIAALDRLTPGRLAPYEIVRQAHAIEVEDLGLQAGIQDQLCSAYGGVNYIQMHNYPHAAVNQLDLSREHWWELEARLSLVYIGQPHSSSDTHRQVIASLEASGGQHPALEAFRQLAHAGKDALSLGEFDRFAEVMNENTEQQRSLHPALISAKHQEVIDIAKRNGAIGCKVNGAAGDGGSVTLLGDGCANVKRRCSNALAEAGFTVIPVYLARQGLRVW
jgi:D-glycero-alpha-D-manno-heptose-7-phosphate kinase